MKQIVEVLEVADGGSKAIGFDDKSRAWIEGDPMSKNLGKVFDSTTNNWVEIKGGDAQAIKDQVDAYLDLHGRRFKRMT